MFDSSSSSSERFVEVLEVVVVVVHVLVEAPKREHGQGHKDGGERGHEPVVVHHLPGRRVVEVVREQSQAEGMFL